MSRYCLGRLVFGAMLICVLSYAQYAQAKPEEKVSLEVTPAVTTTSQEIYKDVGRKQAVSEEEYLGEYILLFPALRASGKTNLIPKLLDQFHWAKDQLLIPGRGGHIVYGRVVLDGGGDPTRIVAQTPILEEGYFLGPVKNLKDPIGFNLHGYAPLDISLEGQKGWVVDLGILHMKPLLDSEKKSAKGVVVLEDNEDLNQVKASLQILNGSINTPSNGTQPNCNSMQPVELRLSSSGEFFEQGFSPVSYYLTVEAPGFVKREKVVDLAKDQMQDLGAIFLERKRKFRIAYYVSYEPPFVESKLQNEVIEGGAQWKAGECPYGWDLKFNQERGKLGFFGVAYGPVSILDLGIGELEVFRSVSKDIVGPSFNYQTPEQVPVEMEHVYLMKQGHWNRWVLFRLEEAN